MAIASIAMALTFLRLESLIPFDVAKKIKWVYSGGPSGARAVLSTIAGSVITVAGTTFSITIAALSLASSQFGPRLLRTFRRDTGNQIVLGTFIATFLYCLMVLRTIRGGDGDTYVPGISVTLGVVMAVLSLVVLIYFIHHTAASIQVSTLINSVSEELECTIEDNFLTLDDFHEMKHADDRNKTLPPELLYGKIIPAKKRGYVLHTDDQALFSLAKQHNCTILSCCCPGEFLVAGMPLARVSSPVPLDEELFNALHNCFYIGMERTPDQDPVFAFLQVTEIAVRALSPGTNDPFTAISCIHRLTAATIMMGHRRRYPRHRYDSSDHLRLVMKVVTYEMLTEAAFQFIRRAATGNREVLNELRSGIDLALERIDNPELCEALQHQQALTAAELEKSPL